MRGLGETAPLHRVKYTNRSFLPPSSFSFRRKRKRRWIFTVRWRDREENLTDPRLHLRRRSPSNRSLFLFFLSFAEAPGELGWVLTLVIVSLVSAGIGAVVMVTLLHCRRYDKITYLFYLSPEKKSRTLFYNFHSILHNCFQFVPIQIITILNFTTASGGYYYYDISNTQKERERERERDSSGWISNRGER